MKSISFFVLLCCMAAGTVAQQKQPKIFRPFYFNFGLNMPAGNFGTSPLYGNNIKQNVLAGYYGAKQGYLFELGTRIYFNKADQKLRYGLDWTFISATYNGMDWSAYSSSKGGTIGDSRIIGLSSKLGPVLSYNIIDKLVVDAHFQAAPTLQYATLDYYHDINTSNYETFHFTADNLTDILGIKTGAGISVRWGVIGVSADYFNGSVQSAYHYTNTATGEGDNTTPVKQKISSSSMQLKLSLNL
ncbi:MAG: hypothetical protein ABIQ88_06395 [Chitinophagaceae bacterium]